MRKSTLSMLLGASMLASVGVSAAPAHSLATAFRDQAPLSRMRKADPHQRWSGVKPLGQKQQRVSPHFTSPVSDTFEYIYAPDGSLWYAVCSYDTEEIKHEYYTEYFIKGFTFTFYDSNFKEIGTVRDKIEFEEGETRCVQVMLGSQTSKQFFNNDANTEVMVSFAMNTNTPNYIVNTRTKAYSIKNLGSEELSTPLSVIAGYPVDAINCAKDKWSEDFYFTFLTEEQPTDPDDYDDLLDFLAKYKKILTTYGKGNNKVFEYTVRQLDLPGDQMNSPMMLCKKVDGNLTLIFARYEKTFFVNPAGMGGNEEITPDNNLIIDIYRMKDSYTKEMELVSTTKIETVQKPDNPDVACTFYGIGSLMWDEDVDYKNYTDDGRPAFIVTTDDYLYSDDDHYNSSYYVYDSDGKRIKTIAENTFDYVMLSDIAGYEPQAMFIHTGDDMTFEFVDLHSCRTVTEIDHQYRGYGLSTSLDRIPTADGYVYASALTSGIPMDDNTLAAPVCWIDSEGEFIRLDQIPTGEGVEMVQIYMLADGLGRFIFNTDTNLEYMMLVKRRVPGLDNLREELVIASVEDGVLHTFTEESGKGSLRMVYLMAGADPQLVISYMNDNNKFTAEAYSLPFSKFAGGSGTAADPYLIATGGDLQQIKSAPAANFRLTDDLDCSGMTFYQIDEFKGYLDGAGHTVKNLTLTTPKNGKTGIFNYCLEATVKDLDFYNAKMILTGNYEAGLVASTASNTKFNNIHVRRISATGDTYSGEFGGIAGKAWIGTDFSSCELTGADIDLPSCPIAGGIVGDIRTGCTITACAVTGNMTANNTLGGIVGSTTTGDEVISFCHVDANLKAENTVGGIVGFLDRSKVKHNYVEGTIEATKPSKWNNSLSLGGIVGELEGDWQGNADVPVLKNLVGVSKLIYPDLSGIVEQHPRQLATVHRIVGRSSYNTYMEEKPNQIIYETGVIGNVVVSDLAVVDQEFAEKTLEGETVDKYEVDEDMLKNQLGFEFGNNTSAPWNIQSWFAYDPSLYYESMAYMPTKELTVSKGKTFEIEIAVLSREELTEDDIIGGFMCEYDESVLEMTGNMTYDGKSMKVEFTAANEGSTLFSASIMGNSTACTVTVVKDQSGTDTITIEGSKLPEVKDGEVMAAGCSIAIVDMAGKTVASGSDTVSVRMLPSGIYVAVATDSDGNRSSLKFAK